MQLLCFDLAGKEYAIDITSVREVRRLKEVTPVPKALDFVEGVICLRGKVTPIINLRKKLGLPEAPKSAFNRTIIVETSHHILGVMVDSVIGVTRIDASGIEEPDEVLNKADYLAGVGKIGKRLVLVVDFEKLLSQEERSGITDIHNKVEVRKRPLDDGRTG